MRCWLMKSEPDDVSIDDLAARPGQTVPWYGVRNYQARNFMRDAMQVGDGVLFYHSGCAEPGIAGIARVASEPTRTPPSSIRRASTSTQGPRPRPRAGCMWTWLRAQDPAGGFARIAQPPELENMRVLARGNRLSITPVEPAEWRFIVGQLLGATDLQDWT
jgi:predicted RNA-binding protein with PUA-like domain